MGAVLEMNSHIKLKVLCVIVAIGVSACGNQPDQGGVSKAIQQVVLKQKSPAPEMPTPDGLQKTIKEALSNTDRRLAIAVVESRNSFTFLTEIATNGSFSTWGSPDRRTITERQGLITASRGLGADLMSADVSDSLRLVRTRKAGQASRKHIYLDGQNKEVETRFTCTIATTGQQRIAIGEISTTVTTVAERCKGGSASFENTYQVAPSGQVVQSRQWLGPVNGFLTVQKLR